VTPEQFDLACQAQGKSYEMLTWHAHQYAHFRFTGEFAEKSLIWDAHLYTLAYYFNTVVESSQPHRARQFIDVGELTPSGRCIHIGLNLPEIDEPAIIKTMIMVRQYKRLASGRYEYGETVDVS
jgi:hypothetical protein